MALYEKAAETLFEDAAGSLIPSVLVGIGAALAAPLLLVGARSLAKEVIKGGIVMADKSRELVAEAGEQWSDLVAEAQAELATATESETEPVSVSTLAREVIKGGMALADKAREVLAEAGEQWSDLMAEARAELDTSAASAPRPAPATESGAGQAENGNDGQ